MFVLYPKTTTNRDDEIGVTPKYMNETNREPWHNFGKIDKKKTGMFLSSSCHCSDIMKLEAPVVKFCSYPAKAKVTLVKFIGKMSSEKSSNA